MALPKTFVAGERLFAEDLNDNFTALDTAVGFTSNASNLTSGTVSAQRLPSGTVVQTKSLYFTDVSIRSFADSSSFPVPNFLLAITPQFPDSKILVAVKVSLSPANSETYRAEVWRKIGTGSFEQNFRINNGIRGQSSVFEQRNQPTDFVQFYLDSPETTDEVTYQVNVGSAGAGTGLGINRANNEAARTSQSSLVLMEVRA